MKVDYIFDFASPNAYLAHKIIPILEENTGSSFEYVPCLLGGIFKLTNNRPPMIAFAEVKNKNETKIFNQDQYPYQTINSLKFYQKIKNNLTENFDLKLGFQIKEVKKNSNIFEIKIAR